MVCEVETSCVVVEQPALAKYYLAFAFARAGHWIYRSQRFDLNV